MSESIGKRILRLRIENDMKQKELADKVGITEATLSRYENDLRSPKGEIVLKLAESLGVSSDYLLGSTGVKESHKAPATYKASALSEKEKIVIDKEAEDMINNLDKMEVVEFCGVIADDEDKEYLKEAYKKFLTDVRVYNKQKYTPKKYRK